MFGMGFWELLIVLACGGIFVVVPVVVIILVVRALQPSGNDRLAQLEEENARLRGLLAEKGIPQGGSIPPKK